MDHLTNLLWHGGKFLGAVWGVWKVVGWLGNVVFSARFVVQWYATEKRKQVVVPSAFWWLSLVGPVPLLVHQRSSAFIFACGFAWDSLPPKLDHPPPPQGCVLGLPKLRKVLSAAVQFLRVMRDAAGC